MAYFNPDQFVTLADWINDHRESENILGVLHTGDLVDNGFKDWQWVNFQRFLDKLDPSLFFLPVAGNHDLGLQSQQFYGYLRQPFLNDYPEEQKFEGGKALYRIQPVGDTDLLLLGIGWNQWMNPYVMRWVDQVLADHESMPCLLIVHGFLLSETKYYQSVEQVIAQRPAIRLVICGHMDDYQTRIFNYDDDGDGQQERAVHAMMLNMQREDLYAFRLLTFDPVSHSLDVRTFLLDGSPATDIPGMGPISFTLENAF